MFSTRVSNDVLCRVSIRICVEIVLIGVIVHGLCRLVGFLCKIVERRPELIGVVIGRRVNCASTLAHIELPFDSVQLRANKHGRAATMTCHLTCELLKPVVSALHLS